MTEIIQKKAIQKEHAPIVIAAILSYNNPLHHPTSGIQAWAMNNNRPVNYRSEIVPTEDQRIRSEINANGKNANDPEIANSKKEHENIDVLDTEQGDPKDLPDTEDPNEVHNEVDDI